MNTPWHVQEDFPWAFSDANDVPVGECYGSANNGKRAKELAAYIVHCVNEASQANTGAEHGK
jgi:hypothetical protein